MLIGDIAKHSDVDARDNPYCEEIGLLTPPLRSAGDYRRYTADTLDELEFIKKGQGLGFSLDEIGEILKLSRAGEAPCSRVLDLAQRNLAAAEERIHQLQGFRYRVAAQIERWKSKARCNARGLCEIISSAELPEKISRW